MEEDSEDVQQQIKVVEKDLAQVERAIVKLQSKKRVLEACREELMIKQQELASAKLFNIDFEKNDYPWTQKAYKVLKNSFKMSKFRPYQLSAINSVMSKHDCILIMQTGGGKSLCYQLPALLLNGIALVVTPLISLMEDQLIALEALKIPAALLNASSTKDHVNKIQAAMIEKGTSLRLLYVTPEKLAKSKRFMAKLEKMYEIGNFSLLAIDEVHCCSQWGNDFRPDYKFLGVMKRQFPQTPVIGLTATATSKVIADIQKILGLPNCLILKSSFNRPNLKYEIYQKPDTQKESIDLLEDLIKEQFKGASGIVYCLSIKESDEIASELWSKGIKAESYHAQLTAFQRSNVHRSWIENNVQVVVATVAFGMGIDKPDVRFVIHHSIAKSMENYYQESGRAGRDDQPAHCILFYRFGDMFRLSTMVFTEQTGLQNLYSMIAYCLDHSRCRRAIIAQHFGEQWNADHCQKMCDICEKSSYYKNEEKDLTKQCLSIYSILEFCSLKHERLTAHKLLEIWMGKGATKLRPPNLNPTTFNQEKCEHILAVMLLEGYLKEEFHFTPYTNISYVNLGSKAKAVKSGRLTVTFQVPTRMRYSCLPVRSNTTNSQNNLIPSKKQRLGTTLGVNDTNSFFQNYDFTPTSSKPLHVTEKSAKKSQKKTKLSPVASVKEPEQSNPEISDDDLDFGENDFVRRVKN